MPFLYICIFRVSHIFYDSGQSSALDELPPETDIEPHINVGAKYQAVCPKLLKLKNGKAETLPLSRQSFHQISRVSFYQLKYDYDDKS